MPVTDRVAAELRRRGVDPERLDETRFADIGVITLGTDYVDARDEEREALFVLRTLVALLPDPDDDEPDDGRPGGRPGVEDLGGWFLPQDSLGGSAEMRRYDEARRLRRALAPGFADLVAWWKRDREITDRNDPQA